jgi:hypothetical protein
VVNAMFVPFDVTENAIQDDRLNSVMYLLYIILYPYFAVILARLIIQVLNIVWIRRIIVNNRI